MKTKSPTNTPTMYPVTVDTEAEKSALSGIDSVNLMLSGHVSVLLLKLDWIGAVRLASCKAKRAQNGIIQNQDNNLRKEAACPGYPCRCQDYSTFQMCISHLDLRSFRRFPHPFKKINNRNPFSIQQEGDPGLTQRYEKPLVNTPGWLGNPTVLEFDGRRTEYGPPSKTLLTGS